MKIRRSDVAAAICLAAVASCGAPELANVPPAIADDCRREVALLTEALPEAIPPDRLPGGEADSADEAIEDARAGRAEEEGVGIVDWPEEVLLYRCLASRGVQLNAEQARVLAEWESRQEPDGTE